MLLSFLGLRYSLPKKIKFWEVFTMNMNEFLDQNQYPVLILQWLELKKSTYCTVGMLCEFVGISKFKAEQYLEELRVSLSEVAPETRITVESTGEIYVTHLSNLVIKKVRVRYLVDSDVFQLLKYTLDLESSLDKFSQERFLGKSQTYDKRKKLITALKQFKLHYKKGKIIGNELTIRSFVYALYLNFFYGLYDPFSDSLAKKIHYVMNRMISHLDLNLTLTQKNKLYFYLGILFTRTAHNHFCPEESSLANTFSTISRLEVFDQQFVSSKENIKNEWQYVLAFLRVEGLLENELSTKAMEQTTLCQEFISQVVKGNPSEKSKFSEELGYEIERLKLKYTIFPVDTEGEAYQQPTSFLEESYPILVEPIREFTKQIQQNNDLFSESQRVYNDLFFSVLFVIPIEYMGSNVYVCVDFTQGEAYTHFIYKQIEGFRNQNIVVQTKISSKTDLFISDFASERLSAEQIIWKEPPNADDWEAFGAIVSQIKQRKAGIKSE
ncbi:hypothetical protein RV11_GL000768 [Enterococcus phoeniculicola]|jgi:hypothetical protein|uniref:Mga helix-turn-helix domain-containing protein n=2 Tax=Enterococcus phoeniculicola TaxID=154621 RepID=R3WCQ5_9ENTE|nr:hypothetical protein UC3_01142 [Enterococcus phoeniculicola ATCC BAA-412]EOT74614.1 hypothetical protein I589_02214 [Enterococcus phoeniculicola ATCC BAA-412]OJG70884.1 hypothetical protein RV11_GL000768 [Enterococcus phoeniculicola]